MKKGLTSLSDDLEDTVKGINDFKKSLTKALKDLKDVSLEQGVKTVSTSSRKVVAPVDGTAKTAAASTLFSLLSGSPAPAQEMPPATAAVTSPTVGGPPKVPGKGPPKRPGTGGPPKAPSSGTVQTPSFAKRPMPPAAPATGVPARPPGAPGAPPASATQAGGGLSSLRDEMLEELNRLKKIMRGD